MNKEVHQEQELERKQATGPLRRLIRRNLFFYVSTNLLFNSIIPYLNFEDPGAVPLFEGALCLARFVLPMAFLLPFIITADILRKVLVLREKGRATIPLPENFKKHRFVFGHAARNAGITIIPVALLFFLLPAGYTLDGKLAAALTGTLAAVLATWFTLQPVKKLLQLHLRYQA